MAEIALLPWESSISADDLHSLVGVPRDYLSKILRKLVAARLLVAEKGHGGGFRLASPPSSVTFQKIFDAVGYSMDADHCAYGWGRCNAQDPCPLHETFNALNRQFVQWAKTTTLADVNQTSAAQMKMKAFSTLRPATSVESAKRRKARTR